MEEKRKRVIKNIIAIVLLLTLIIGSTYAFFNISIKNNTTESKIKVSTGELNSITLKGTNNNALYIKIDSEDMKKDLVGTKYYATTDENKDYIKDEKNLVNIANLEVNGKVTPSNICTAKIKIELSGDLAKEIKDDDVILHIEGGRSAHDIDLAMLLKDYPIEFVVSEKEVQAINAYLELTNRDTDQSYIAGKTLKVTITINSLSCKVQEEGDAIEVILANSDGDTLEKKEDVSYRGDILRRFQGSAEKVDDNYICFGTDSVEECKNNEGKYMYRIMGYTINEDEETNTKAGQIKLIKKEALDTKYEWNNPVGHEFTWENSMIYKGINGDYFLTNSTYMDPEWSKLISTRYWKYSSALIVDSIGALDCDQNSNYAGEMRNSLEVYKCEKRSYEERVYHGMAKAKIGIIRVHDFYLATGKDAICAGVSGYESQYNECTKNWIYLGNNDDVGPLTASNSEMTMNRYYREENDDGYGLRSIAAGAIHGSRLTHLYFVRPTFYLEPGLKLSGKGSINEPYIIVS